MPLIDLVQLPNQTDNNGYLHCHHYYTAISHYRQKDDGSWERSFIQHYYDLPARTHEEQLQNGHARVNALANLKHGEYRAEMHSVDLSHPHLLAQKHQHQKWATYHEYVAPPTTQTVDAITGKKLSKTSIFIVHAGDANPTTHYQAILQEILLGTTISDCTFTTNTFENAIDLAHRIIDEILHPYHLAYHGQEATDEN